jgi:AcrR family transcriptional regulator
MRTSNRNRRNETRHALPGDKTEQMLIEGLDKLLDGGASFTDITVADISKSAGVTRSAFYFYFPSKSMALLAAIEHVRLKMFNACDPVFKDYDSDFFSSMGTVINEVARLWGKHRALFTAIIDGSASDAKLQEIWIEWMLSFSEGILKRTGHELNKAGVSFDNSLLENLVTRLLWTNERNFYYFFKDIHGSDQETEDFVTSLVLVWKSSLQSVFIRD